MRSDIPAARIFIQSDSVRNCTISCLFPAPATFLIPTSLALYGFTTDWGATLPLTLASGILGTASIVAMTSYAFSRADIARKMNVDTGTSLRFGISPLNGGALATLVLNF